MKPPWLPTASARRAPPGSPVGDSCAGVHGGAPSGVRLQAPAGVQLLMPCVNTLTYSARSSPTGGKIGPPTAGVHKQAAGNCTRKRCTTVLTSSLADSDRDPHRAKENTWTGSSHARPDPGGSQGGSCGRPYCWCRSPWAGARTSHRVRRRRAGDVAAGATVEVAPMLVADARPATCRASLRPAALGRGAGDAEQAHAPALQAGRRQPAEWHSLHAMRQRPRRTAAAPCQLHRWSRASRRHWQQALLIGEQAQELAFLCRPALMLTCSRASSLP
jgi:hypothetical protein